MRTLLLGFLVLEAISALTREELAYFNVAPNTAEKNTGVRPLMSITDNGDGTLTIKSNGIPNHETGTFPSGNTNPNNIRVQHIDLTVNKVPVMRPDGSEIYCLPLGMVGVSITGEQINSWFPAIRACPTAPEIETLDICEGHPSPDGSYHQHHFSPCLLKQTCDKPSGIVGVAIDGIPIYGSWDENGKQLTQSDLDSCGGRWDKDGRYKYHVTVDPPYYLGCIKGEIRRNSGLNLDTFFCSCPFDGSYYMEDFPDGPPPKDKKGDGDPFSDGGPGKDAPKVCTDPGSGKHLSCKDTFDMTQIPTRNVSIKEVKTVKLAPCCPEGSNCGKSCIELVDGKKKLKSSCIRENREIKVWKFNAGVAATPFNIITIILITTLMILLQ